MTQPLLFNLSPPTPRGVDDVVEVRPNVWLMSAEDIPPLLFTPEEVASFLRIGRHRVFDLIRQGALRSVKIGNSRRVSARALAEFVAQLEVARRRDWVAPAGQWPRHCVPLQGSLGRAVLRGPDGWSTGA